MTLDEIKTSAFVVGLKETERALKSGKASSVFIASDCDERISSPLLKLCAEDDIPVSQEYTKKELGHACGIKVKAAACAILSTR